MNIALITNTFTPHVGGVARSVEAFRAAYTARGHRVLVVAPEFPDAPVQERGVLRVPALQNFNASDFSVALPVPSGLRSAMTDFSPDIIHSQHPFLLGMTALRLARTLERPLLFTHHTLYERYTHYVPGRSEVLESFIIELATCYANLADRVIAPSESIRDTLRERGVETPLAVVPTGLDAERFASGNGSQLRRQLQIPSDAFVVCHMGRLAPEKNIDFLGRAVCDFLEGGQHRYFLVVGDGECREPLAALAHERGLQQRLHCTGTLEGQGLIDALAAGDVFAFASTSETQGMVITEAMAARLPVVALRAPGVLEVVRDCHNGRLLDAGASTADFAAALDWIEAQTDSARQSLIDGARSTADAYSMDHCAERALACYRDLRRRSADAYAAGEDLWNQARLRIGAELDILRSLNSAGSEALSQLSGSAAEA